MARVNEQRTTDVTRVLKTPNAELRQNACGERLKYANNIDLLRSASPSYPLFINAFYLPHIDFSRKVHKHSI